MHFPLKPAVFAALIAVPGLATGPALADQPPVIGANNTTYSPQNFAGRWKLRQPDREICQVVLELTDASPHALTLRGCTHAAIAAATQWEMRDRTLVFFTEAEDEIGPFKVTAPNTLEVGGMVLFR